jgi:hypothetical protein
MMIWFFHLAVVWLATLIIASVQIPLLLMQDWLAGSLYKDMYTGNIPGRRVTSILTTHLSLGKKDKPLSIAEGIFLEEVRGDWLGRTLLVDVKARRNHMFAGETCELTIKAICSRAIAIDVIAYDTSYCEKTGNHSFCKGWAKRTDSRVSLRKGEQAVLTGWCRCSFIPLARKLTTSWADGRTVTYLHTVTTVLPTYHSWLVSCK